jgi:hypothetical protein
MRRVSLLVVIVLFSSLLGALPSPPVLGQQNEADCTIVPKDPAAMRIWECVEEPTPVDDKFTPGAPQPASGNKKFQPYTVVLKAQYAAVPDIRDEGLSPEYMVVTVAQGDFALDLKKDSPSPVIVDPVNGREVHFMERVVGARPYYRDTDNPVVDGAGAPCVHMCAIPADSVVHVQTHDTVYALEGAFCLWCLLTKLGEDGNPDQGQLDVLAMIDANAAPEDFSWIQSWRNEQATPTANTAPSGTMKAWVLLNPGTGCRDH